MRAMASRSTRPDRLCECRASGHGPLGEAANVQPSNGTILLGEVATAATTGHQDTSRRAGHSQDHGLLAMALNAQMVEQARRSVATGPGRGQTVKCALTIVKVERCAVVRGDGPAQFLEYTHKGVLLGVSHATGAPRAG